MNRQPKISFMTTLGCNVGDEFIREGICSFLDEIFDDWLPFYVNKVDLKTLQTHALDEACALKDKFQDTDIIIQAGAPVYWNINESTSYNVEWAEELWEKRIFKLGHTKPILNIAAGACQPYPGFAKDFLQNAQCREFAQKVDSSCAWTSVRDPLASQILYALNIEHDVLPCSAFHAARRLKTQPCVGTFIGVNLMPKGGHYRLKENIDSHAWDIAVQGFLTDVRKRHKLLFIAHDLLEVEYMKQFVEGDEKIFHSTNYLDYLPTYGQCAAVVANRVHGGVCAAGFGRPSIIVGNDTRLLIADYIGIPSFYVADVDAPLLIDVLETAVSTASKETDRLLELRENSALRYIAAIKSSIESFPSFGNHAQAKQQKKDIALASVEELHSQRFLDFMNSMNCFARRYGLREFTNWSKVWEYPWLWENCLSEIDWKNTRLLDLGSEISPMPWFLASLGAEVVLVETDPQWISNWENLKDLSGLKVTWKIVSGEKLPFEDNYFDAITSFSVIEHQPDKVSAIEEVIRVLKPEGEFALSFDICEETLGMSFPEWNGKALTMAEFEEVIWKRPEFKKGFPITWNIKDAGGFLSWHLQSAPHHNYIVGAAHFQKDLFRGVPITKILIPRLDTIGDMVLLQGFLAGLTIKYPNAEITLLVREGYDQLAPLFPKYLKWISTALHPYRYSEDTDLQHLETLLTLLADSAWDLVLFTTYNRTWIDDVVAAKLPGVTKIALGEVRTHDEYFKPMQEFLDLPCSPAIDKFVSVNERAHETEKYQTFWNALFHDSSTLSLPSLEVPEPAQAEAGRVLSMLGLTGKTFFVCAPVGGLNIPIKTWPADRFAETICCIHATHGIVPLLVGHEAEAGSLQEVQQLVQEKGGPCTFKWVGTDGEIAVLAALMERAQFYIGNDSGPMHISAAIGVPTIGIFGGGHYPRFLPVGRKVAHVAVKLPCYGCGWECIFGDAPCIKAVEIDAATSIVDNILLCSHPPIQDCVIDHSEDKVLQQIIGSSKRMIDSLHAQVLFLGVESEAAAEELRAQLHQQTETIAQLTTSLSAEKETLETTRASFDSKLAAAENEINALRSSLSWKITAPLRSMYNKLFSRSA